MQPMASRSPAFGLWPQDGEPRTRDLLVEDDDGNLMALEEAEARADAQPVTRRPRTPYRGARVDRSGLAEAAIRAASAQAQRRGMRR